MDTVDFITFVCRELNHSDPSDGFDTFEVGSVKIEPTQWHISSKFPPHADARDAVIRQILEQPMLIKKDAEHKSCQVIKDEGTNVSCDTNPIVSLPVEDRFLGRKLEETKRKLREQYEKIENEKKKRRIQIIEFQKPSRVQTKAKKPPVKKRNKRNGLLGPATTQLHPAHHVSIF